MKKVLVTGGAGFMGSDFIRLLSESRPHWQITNLDCLTYAGNLKNLSAIEKNKNYRFVKGNICDRQLLLKLLKEKFDYLINFAAESHVDRSISDSSMFIKTNVEGTQTLLEAIRQYPVNKYIQISTDEVYGSLEAKGEFSEQSPLAPNNPYAASKASADLLVRAYQRTYGLPLIISRCCNNYGEYQHSEKFIPHSILNLLKNKKISIYGEGKNVRDWIYVRDHSLAIFKIIEQGRSGETYNIGCHCQLTNLTLARIILQAMDKDKDFIEFIADRPGHDFRYAIDSSKIRKNLGWQEKFPNFAENIKKTIGWYGENYA